jgi:hypothetical protein
MTTAEAFVSCKTARDNCVASGNTEWEVRWHDRLDKLVDYIPTWSGMTLRLSGVEIKPDAIRYEVSYHHMNETGHYDGWTEHTVVVRPAFGGIDVRISGRDRNDVKELIHETVRHAFTRHVTWDEPHQRWIVESDDARHAAEERAYPREEQPCPTT